jgi:hypothetical protein
MTVTTLPGSGRPTTQKRHGLSGSSVENQVEAHVPTLKGLGKSDCEVKIISILECETVVSENGVIKPSSCV